MLFDLRSPGRRRTVQAVYLTLAVLMGGGLVFFGIGSDVAGGLFEGLAGNRGGDTASPLEQQAKQAEQRVRANPRDAASWAQLATARYQLATQGENYDQNTARYTAKGRQQLGRAVQAWERHLSMAGDRPSVDTARLMVQAYSPLGLNQPDKGVRAAEIVAEAQPTPQTYYQLAVYAYAAGQDRKAELAGERAAELAPADQRAQVRDQIKQAREQRGFPSAAGGATPPASG